MAAPDPVRKSGRARVLSRKAAEDVVSTLNQVLDQSEAEEIPGRSSLTDQIGDDSDDDDFVQDDAVAIQESADSDSNAGPFSAQSSQVNTPEGEPDEFEPQITPGKVLSRRKAPTAVKVAGPQRPTRATKSSTEGLHLKGFHEGNKKPTTSQGRLLLFSGPGEQEIDQLVQVRDCLTQVPTLPKRSQFFLPLNPSEERRKRDATVGWDWYYEAERHARLSSRQVWRPLNGKEQHHLMSDLRDELRSLIGPYGRQKMITLPPFQSIQVCRAWPQIQTNTEEATGKDAPEAHRRIRHDWMINPGGRVRCLDWAPNQSGEKQYLALGTGHDIDGRSQDLAASTPGITPRPHSRSRIHIWSFRSTHGDPIQDQASEMDPRHGQPRLERVLCADWGNPRQIKWCPVPREARDEGSRDTVYLGLLASVWGDGYMRVVDMRLDKTKEEEISYCTCLVQKPINHALRVFSLVRSSFSKIFLSIRQ